MTLFNTKLLDQYPLDPGVYLMKDKKGEILYVGKSKQIRSRLKQYFIPGRDTRPIIPLLVSKISSIDTIVVTSEKEALLLESTLIKKHKPRYNALLKDDKSYISLKINTDHPWPMLQLVRLKGQTPKKGLFFGPYISAWAARQTLELMKKLFPLRQCSDRELVMRTRPCILYEMKRCIAPCVGKCTPDFYHELVKKAIEFLKGHDKNVLKDLYLQMEEASQTLEYEKAAALLRTIQQIETTLEKQNVTKTTDIDLDALGFYRLNDDVLLTILVMRSGKLTGARSFSFKKTVEEDGELLQSFILQYYLQKQERPRLLLLPFPIDAPQELQEILNEGAASPIELTVPKKGEKKALANMACDNAKAEYEKQKNEQGRKEQTLFELQETLNLINYPRRIECFDNSHINGTNPVAGMVVFHEGSKQSSQYRKYKLRAIDPSDDYGAMREVLERRYCKAKEEGTLPDLIVIDGGKGQLSSAIKILEQLDISTVDVIALAKDESRHDKGMTAEKIFRQGRKDPLYLSNRSPLLFFLQQVRDEAHRFALTFHKKRRSLTLFTSSLDQIRGIGPVKKKRLLQSFGSAKSLQQASKEQLALIPGINQTDIAQIQQWQQSQDVS